MILADEEIKISEKISNEEEFIKLDDNIINIIYNFESNSEKIKKQKELIFNIRTRNLYKMITNLLINKNDVKNIKRIIYRSNIKKRRFDNNFYILNYNIGTNNPVNNVYFYNKNIKDKNNKLKSFNIKRDKVSRLLPVEFEEIYLRIYCKNQDKINYAKKNKKNHRIIKNCIIYL